MYGGKGVKRRYINVDGRMRLKRTRRRGSEQVDHKIAARSKIAFLRAPHKHTHLKTLSYYIVRLGHVVILALSSKHRNEARVHAPLEWQ